MKEIERIAIQLNEIDLLIKTEIVNYIQNLDAYSQQQIIETNEGKFNFGSIHIEFTLEPYTADWNFDVSYDKYEFVIDLKNIYYKMENN